MKAIIKSKNIELSEAIKTLIEEKTLKLGKPIKTLEEKGLDNVFIEVSKETRHHKKGDLFKAQFKIHLPGKTIYADSVTENLTVSIGDAKEKIEAEIKKYKLKKISLARKRERELKKELKISPQAKKQEKGILPEEEL